MIRDHIYSLTFNGVDLSTYGLHTSGPNLFNSPEYDYEFVEVPGRSGDLTIDRHRYKNIQVTYRCFIAADTLSEFSTKMRGLRNFLLSSRGYKRLEDTYQSDEFRLASFVGPLETEAILLRAGEFDLTFNCKPQRYLKTGETPTTYPWAHQNEYDLLTSASENIITAASETIIVGDGGSKRNIIENPTLQTSKPLLRVYGTGQINIVSSEASYYFTISDHSGIPYIDIDCDLCDCYYDATNCNSYVSFNSLDFPEFTPGNNYMQTEPDITQVIITPRWWNV